MRNKCYLVKLKELVSISEKAYKAIAYDGSEAILPKSQVIKPADEEDSWWITCWIMDQKNLQHSKKNMAWIDTKTMQVQPVVTVVTHVPKSINPIDNDPDSDLIR
jgi:hypothetical protein